VKIIVTRGSGAAESLRPTVIVVSRDWPADLVARRRDGVDARISGTRLPRLPRLAGIKHLNRLAYVLADQDRQADPAQEIILRDTQGYVIETTRANIFCVRSGRLHTPDLRYAGVRGVVRDEVMAIARGLGMAVAVAWLTPRELFTADEVFVTNAVIGICPVRRIEGRDYPVGPVTTKLQEALTV
jgi:4-amino-4-deoxychorismate lyase